MSSWITRLGAGGAKARERRSRRELVRFADDLAARAVVEGGGTTGQAAGSASIDLTGTHYRALLDRMHEVLQPKTYVEIGVNAGETFALSAARSLGIDPGFALERDIMGGKPSAYLYQGTSDAFFDANEPETFLGGPIDLALVDGMHRFEFVLRDFMNLERHSRRGAHITFHDVVPCDPHVTGRVQGAPEQALSGNPNWWTGDVWKVIPILKDVRPDLSMTVLDAHPTGVLVVTNLDPKSSALEKRYKDVVASMLPVSLGAYGFDRFIAECRLSSTEAYMAALTSDAIGG